MFQAFNASALWSPAMAMAWLLAPLAAFVAMDLSGRVNEVKAKHAIRWRLGAALGLGTGIWSSQVLGLSTASLAFTVGYHPLWIFVAWLLATLVSLAALALCMGPGNRARTAWRPLAGAVVLGSGMVLVQVVAMTAMGLRPGLHWSPAGLTIAASASTAACAVAFALARRRTSGAPARALAGKWLAAFVWGLAVVPCQHLVIASAGLPDQVFSAHDQRLTAAALTLLASLGSMLVLLAMLWMSRVEAHLRASLTRTRGELAEHSVRDALTKLPNRLRFEGTLAQAATQADERRGKLALLFINVDGFKQFNQSGGHASGDRLLCEMATRLRSVAGPHMVARVGGDEFVLLLPDDPHRDAVATQAGALLKLLSQPCQWDGQETAVSCSIGIAMYPQDGALSTMMAHADVAMREAKIAGGASYCFFEARMVNGAREQSELLRDLRQALARRELELLYQPKVHAQTGEISGVEALIRWHHPKRGLISPATFIPVAERFGLIEAIGNWVIDEACRQARAWRDDGLRMRVAINLSPHQLRDPELGPRIGAALKKYRINPKLLTCEITESVAMEDSAATMKFFAVLAGVGVHISIDDFGTGYSSLAYLRKLPAEELKIDRSFVCDLETSEEARKVADAVVKLGQSLNLKVVAEGVETEAQHQILRLLGCDELQGYLFAKPMSAKALALWAINDMGPRQMGFRPSLFQPTAPLQIH